LTETNFIAQEMELWKNEKNTAYVVTVERVLSEAFSPSIYKHRETDHGGDGVYLPPHFFGELGKTKEGCEILESTNHISEFIACLKSDGNPLEKKSALWALGNIGSSKTGFKFIENGVLETIVKMAENSSCLSIRGTCFYVLGMISHIDTGRDKLASFGWESPSNPNSWISLPKNINKSNFFRIPSYQHVGSFATSNQIQYPEDNNETRQEILTAVGHLSNFISAESASRTLKRIKASNPEHFMSASLLYSVFKLLGTYKFRLPVRRFVYDIFDSVVWNEENWAAFDAME